MVYRRRGFFCEDLCAPVIMAFHPSFSALSRSSTTPPGGLGLSLTPPAVKITPASSEVAFAYAPGLGGRACFTGVNWSPATSSRPTSIMVVPAVCVGCLTRFSSFAATKGSKWRNSRLPGRRLRRHPAVARDRAGAIAAAVEEQQNARRVGARRARPFARHAAAIDALAAHVAGDGPYRADLVEPRPPLGPADRPRPFRQHRADGVDLFVRHDLPRATACTNPAKPQRCSGLIGVPARLSASSRGCPVSKLHASLKLKGGSGQPWSGEAQEPRRLLDLDLRPRGESRLNVVQRCSARRLRFWLCDSPVCAIARTRLVAYSAPSSGATCGGSRSR